MDEICIPVLRDGDVEDKYSLLFLEVLVRDPHEKPIIWHPIDMLLDTGSTRTLLPNPRLKTARTDKSTLPKSWLKQKNGIEVRSSTSVRVSPEMKIRFTLPTCGKEFDATVGFMPGPDDISPELAEKSMLKSIRRSVGNFAPAPFTYGVLSLNDVLKHFNISIDDTGMEFPFVLKLSYRAGGHAIDVK